MRYCCVPHGTPKPTPCRQHFHISSEEKNDLLRHRAAEWLVTPVEAKQARTLAVLRFLGAFPVRGFSARYGAALASRRGDVLVRLILSEITKRRMEDA